jgi:hypothetical protein
MEGICGEALHGGLKKRIFLMKQVELQLIRILYTGAYNILIRVCTYSLISVADPECLSRIRIFSISDRICIKEFKYVFQPGKGFLSSRKYDPGCSSWIRIPDPNPDFLPIPDPGSKRHRIPDLDSQN